jgi:hypothetical protein
LRSIGALRRQEQVLGQLLGQCRTALNHSSGCQVGHHGAGQTDRVDTKMRVEATVLDGDDGFWNVRRHFAQQQGFAAGCAAIGHGLAVDGRRS